MSVIHKLLAVACIGVVALAGYSHLRSTSREADADGRLRAIEEELKAVKKSAASNGVATRLQRRRMMENSLLIRPDAPTTAHDEELERDEGEQDLTEAEIEASDAADADQRAHLTAVFEQQGVDRSWASEAEQNISDELRQLTGDSNLESVECRELLCQATIRHDNPSQKSGFWEQLGQNSHELWKGRMVVYSEDLGERGSSQSKIYFVRGDGEVPRL